MAFMTSGAILSAKLEDFTEKSFSKPVWTADKGVCWCLSRARAKVAKLDPAVVRHQNVASCMCGMRDVTDECVGRHTFDIAMDPAAAVDVFQRL